VKLVRPTRRPSLPLAGGALALALTVSFALARGSLGEVGDLFAAGRYDEAREALARIPSEAESGGAVLVWRQRLEDDPDRACALALEVVRNQDHALEVRVQSALDAASIALARQRTEEGWQLLRPLLDLPPESLPGDIYLLAGEALRQAGDRQRAREMLATVRPDDPAFAAARSLLGRITLESGDKELALRYFAAGARQRGRGAEPEMLAGRWQVLADLGRESEAAEVAAELMRDYPSSLAAMEVGTLARRALDDQAAAGALDPSAATTAPVQTGRFAVQLAAFRDRALAMQFVERWRGQVTGLRVVTEVDELGQPIYKVQTGSFDSAAQARAEVDRLARTHRLEGFVAGSGD